MAGTYPTTPEFQAINLESKHNNLVSETVSGRQQVRSIGGQRWSFSARYNPMTRAEFQPVFAFVMAQQGRFGTFQIIPPVIGSTSGTATGSLLVNGAASAGATTVNVDGITGTIKAGDFIKFSGHSKVYMLVSDRDGDGAMTIEPPLVSSVSNNELISYEDVQFTMRLDNDLQSYSLSANEYYEYEIDMIEVL